MACAYLFEDAGFSGNSRYFCNNDLNARYAIGAYNPVFKNFGWRHRDRFNDYASSVILTGTGYPSRNTFVAFQDLDFSGIGWAYAYTTGRAVSYFGNGFNYNGQFYRTNDQASSAIIIKHPDTTTNRPLLPLSLQVLTNLKGDPKKKINDLIAAKAPFPWPVSSVYIRDFDQLKFQFVINNYYDPQRPYVRWTWPLTINMTEIGIGALFQFQHVDVSFLINFYPVYSGGFGNVNVSVEDITISGARGLIANQLTSALQTLFNNERQTVQDELKSGLDEFLSFYRRFYPEFYVQSVYLMPGGSAWNVRGNTGFDPFQLDSNNIIQPALNYFIPHTNYDTTLVLVPDQY